MKPSSDSPISQINVTPLVDVLLVLLIIFMITAPAAANRLSIALPHQDLDAKTIEFDELRIAVAADGAVRVDGVSLPLLLLEAELINRQGGDTPIRVTLDVAANAQHQQLIDVLAILQQRGITAIQFEGVSN